MAAPNLPIDLTARKAAINDPDLLLRTVQADVALAPQAGGRRYAGLCPFHAENSPSFYVFTTSSRHGPGFHCFGCGRHGRNAVDYVMYRDGAEPGSGGTAFLAAVRYLGLEATSGPRRALPPIVPPPATPAPPRAAQPNRAPDAVFAYRRPDGTVSYEVCRWDWTVAEQVLTGKHKTFRQRQPKPGGGWRWEGVAADDQLLYRLPELLADLSARPDDPVFLVEGEKCVDACRAAGLIATCNSGGAMHWPSAWSSILAGRLVVILPDNDPRGYEHAGFLLDELADFASAIKLIVLAQVWPGCPPHGDAADFLAAGWHPDALRALAAYAGVVPAAGQRDSAPPAAVAALEAANAELQARVEALEARGAQIDALMRNPDVDPSLRALLYNLHRTAETEDLAAGGQVITTQVALGEAWGVSTDTVKRTLAATDAMGLTSHSVRTQREVARNPRSKAVRIDPQTGDPLIKHTRQTVLALHARPLETTIHLASPPSAKGNRHGGTRTPTCPNPDCPEPTSPQATRRACTACGTVYDPKTNAITPPVAVDPNVPPPTRPARPTRRQRVDVPPEGPCPECGRRDYRWVPDARGRYHWRCPGSLTPAGQERAGPHERSPNG